MDTPSDALKAHRKELQRTCRRLHGATVEPIHLELQRVATWCDDNDIEADSYGEGEHLQAFEARVAAMLGYPAARFMPSGTMAQQIATRVWSDRASIPVIGMHPTCHLELHENRGYERLHRLSAVFVGERHRPMMPEDLAKVATPISTLVIELPTRENGGRLAPWEDLVALSELARGRGVATHLDGARLWEAAAGYDRPLEEICALFDSTYVSFYKGIGALPGSVLAGPEDVIDDAKIWQARHGGSLFTTVANWVSAAMRLDDQLARMSSYRDRARLFAAALVDVDGVVVDPVEPQVNMFHVFLSGDRDSLLGARDRIAEEHGLWLFGGLQTTDVPDVHKFEVAIADAAFEVEPAEITAAFRALVDP